MSWTAPRTWVTGETLTSTLLNTHLRDNLLTLGGAIGAAYTPAAVNTDLAAPTNWMHTIAPTAAAWSVRSIAAAPQAGQPLTLRNTTAFPITLLNAAAGGTGAQLTLRGGASAVLGQNESITLIYDGTTWNEISRGYSIVSTRVVSVLDVVSTLTETSMFTPTLPPNALGASGISRVTVVGDYLNNTGAGQTLTHRIKFGATTFWGHAIAPPTGANRYPWMITFLLGNIGLTNSNYMNGTWWIGNTASGAVGSVAGLLGLSAPIGVASSGAQAIDSTLSQNIDITAQHGANSASLSCRRILAMVEVL